MKKSTPQVSILMTVFNGEKFIFKSIDSIIKQTYNNWELVIINDKSTDNTIEIIKSFKDKRIKLINLEKNVGRTSALNFGLKKCKSKYVAIQDSDDVSMKNRIKNQLNLLIKDKKLALVFSWYKRIDKFGNVKKIFNENISDRKLKIILPVKNLICHSSVMYKKSLILQLGGYPKDYIFSQEYILWLKIMTRYKMKLVRSFLVNYRDHDDQLSNSKSQQKYIFLENLKTLSWAKNKLLINRYNLFNYYMIFLINYLKLIKSYL